MKIQNRRGIFCLVLAVLMLARPVWAAEAGTHYEADPSSAVYQACQTAAQQMDATQILVYDAGADKLLYSQGVQGDKLFPASTTKLYSAYVGLQYLSQDAVLTAGDELELVKPGSSVAYIAKGHQLTVQTLVEAMLLPSGNDAALVFAAGAGRVIAGDEDLGGADAVRVFVEQMNQTAQELGFEKSHFANPDGYHMGAHYTCVNDMVRIAKLALENETIHSCMTLHEVEEVFVSGQSIRWTNTNRLLDPDSEFYSPDAVGMKTGHTNQAGYCLMSAFARDNTTIVIGVFGYQSPEGRWNDVIRLLDACQ